MSLNKVMLIGNVGKDPEIRYIDGNSSNGQKAKVASFPLATSERYKDRNGETREITEWHNIVAWRNSADIVERYVKKGTQLYIEGRIRTRQWTDQSGVKRYSTEITADSLQLLGRRGDGQDASTQGQDSPYSRQPQARPQAAEQAPRPAEPRIPAENLPGADDDLPF